MHAYVVLSTEWAQLRSFNTTQKKIIYMYEMGISRKTKFKNPEKYDA